jgi:Protein of unknown function (DUF3179)
MLSSFSPAPKPSPRAILLALGLLFASLGAFAFAAYPIYVIRPFREQAPAALERALWVSLHNKPILLGIAIVIAVFAVMLWRRGRWASKLLLVPATVIAILAAVVSWINPYEHMFHPLGAPNYIAANQASVDPNDMVIAVTIGGESRAYPIREMGYHHVVNDRLHQLPIVVTY